MSEAPIAVGAGAGRARSRPQIATRPPSGLACQAAVCLTEMWPQPISAARSGGRVVTRSSSEVRIRGEYGARMGKAQPPSEVRTAWELVRVERPPDDRVRLEAPGLDLDAVGRQESERDRVQVRGVTPLVGQIGGDEAGVFGEHGWVRNGAWVPA